MDEKIIFENISIKDYVNNKAIDYINVNLNEFLTNNHYPFYSINKHIDTTTNQIYYLLHFYNNKKQIILTYFLPIEYLPKDENILKYHYYKELIPKYYLEWIEGNHSCFSLFSFSKEEDQFIKYYIKRFNFAYLPKFKYFLDKLEKEPKMIEPLLLIPIKDFIIIYKDFYDTICSLRPFKRVLL